MVELSAYARNARSESAGVQTVGSASNAAAPMVSEDVSTRRDLGLIQAGQARGEQEIRERELLQRIQWLLRGLREAGTLEQAWKCYVEGMNVDLPTPRGCEG